MEKETRTKTSSVMLKNHLAITIIKISLHASNASLRSDQLSS